GGPVTLIDTGSAWRYLDTGTDQGTAWKESGFNDSSWNSGAAQLGYGDGDEATVVSFGGNASNKRITTYFRRSFNVSNSANVTALSLALLRDDGAIVYVNGTEVARSNLPGGAVGYTTRALTGIGGAAESVYNNYTIAPGLLQDGTNVVAVEIHQVSPSSSDLSFDLLLVASNGAAGSSPFVVYENDFDSGAVGNWVVVDNAGNPSNWVVANNAFEQQSHVRVGGVTFEESYHLGTYAYLNLATPLQDYRFSVDVTPLAEDGDNIGIMFHYQNENNYYRFSMDSRFGYARLEKRVAGIFSPIASNARGYTIGDTINLSGLIEGSTISVYLDGLPLFAVDDSSLLQGSVALYSTTAARFDNVLITDASVIPSVVINTPQDYSIITGDTVSIEALAYNAPSGASVRFYLNGTLIDTDNVPPYRAQFTGLTSGEYSVVAELYDSSNTLLSSDTRIRIGVLGQYTIGVGDSITNGSRDNKASDNVSNDGRIVGIKGYEAPLNNLLTAERGYAHLIVNEGVGGDTSEVTVNERIDSINLRHPAANTALLMLGTNDSGGSLSTPSGSGCVPNESCYVGSYKQNMQDIVNALVASGKNVTVALPPPAFGASTNGLPYANPANSSRNALIREYAAVVKGELNNISIGPDFYKCFLDEENFYSLFADNLHPNGMGYNVIAELWNANLNGRFSVSDVCPIQQLILRNLSVATSSANVKQNHLEVGDDYYVDENFVLNNIPGGLGLEDGVWIMTDNSDKANASVSYLSFDVDRNVTVYIAYDQNGGATLPTWMNGYTDTGMMLDVSDPDATLVLYSQNFASGTVNLGGNLASGASGADSHYLVIVVEQ
ncbi:MAG: hypothetical protein GXP14_02945, partial [Gammaproteobacteria bacterium]|nr:hypothetical protein [Gammaproteobacteria bacterium]